VIALVNDLQQDPQHRWIGLIGELSLAHMAPGLRVERVEPNTTVGGLLEAVSSHPEHRFDWLGDRINGLDSS
jgi:hypothetical protein